MRIVFVRGIHQHEACRLRRVIGSKDTNIEAGDGFPDEHDAPGNPATREEFRQLACDPACCPRRGPGIAVAHAGPIVGADTRESSNLRLDKAPASTRAAETRVEDDSRRAVPGAPQVQPIASDVDEMSWRRRRREVLSSRKPLIRGAGECGNEKEPAQRDENALRPAPHVTSPVNRALSRSTPVTSGFNVHWPGQRVNLRVLIGAMQPLSEVLPSKREQTDPA